jgi:hypothetical protein
MTCHLIGDSIALGLAAVMHCTGGGTVGASSAHIATHLEPRPAGEIDIVSAGSNDGFPDLRALRAIRAHLHGTVVWVIPRRNAGAVQALADANGDWAVAFTPGRDGIHPRSYRALARAVEAAL